MNIINPGCPLAQGPRARDFEAWSAESGQFLYKEPVCLGPAPGQILVLGGWTSSNPGGPREAQPLDVGSGNLCRHWPRPGP